MKADKKTKDQPKKETPNKNIIRFSAQVYGVKTLVDGGVNITLSLTRKEDISEVMKLLQVKQAMGLLEVAAVAILPEKLVKVGKPEEKPQPKTRDMRRK